MKWIWTNDDINILNELYSTNISIEELENKLNKPYEVIRKYANKIGLKRLKNNSKMHDIKLNIIKDKCNKINYKFISFNNDVNKYINAFTNFKILCNNNHIFNTNYNKFINCDTTCFYCNNMYDKTEEYLIKIKDRCKTDNIKLINTPQKITQKTKLIFKCAKEHEFKMDYTHFVIRKQMCNKCNNKPLDERIIDIENKCITNNYCFLGFTKKYDNYKTPFKIQCKYNHIWTTTYSNFISHPGDRGCPRCNESKGEKKISKYLDDLNIKYIREYKFDDCIYKRKLRFDFYIPDYNLCIEFNGKQHYQSFDIFGGNKSLLYIQNNDNIKKEYCNKNNILLHIIKYNDNIIEKLNSIF